MVGSHHQSYMVTPWLAHLPITHLDQSELSIDIIDQSEISIVIIDQSEISIVIIDQSELSISLRVLTSRTGAARVQHLHVNCLEDGRQLVPELLIALVNVAVSHDVERCPHQGEQSGVEVDCSISIEAHVHGDQSLAGHTVRTQLAKAQGRRYLPEQRDNIHMLDTTLGIRIIL